MELATTSSESPGCCEHFQHHLTGLQVRRMWPDLVPAAGITSPGEVAPGCRGAQGSPSCTQGKPGVMQAAGLGHWHFGVPGEAPHLLAAMALYSAPLTEHRGDVFLVCCFPQAVILLSKGVPLCS